MADHLGMKNAAAYDLSAGCTGFVYAIAQAHSMVSAGLANRALVVGGDLLSKIVDWGDRGTCVLFGDGAGAVVMERVPQGGFLGFELGADGSGGPQLYLPAGGSREPTSAETFAEGEHYVKMNGREVFKFAARVLVESAEKVLENSGVSVGDVDVLRPASGERPHHRARQEKARHSRRAHCGQRRPVRQHVVRLDPARARRCRG